MAKKTTTGRALRPSSANTTGPQAASKAATKPKKARKGPANGEVVMQMLSRPHGVSLEELMKKLGVQQHTARAYISVESRKAGKKAVPAEGRYTLAP